MTAALTSEALEEFVKSWSAHDLVGIRELSNLGLLVSVKQGTKVRKIDSHGFLSSIAEVRILEGKHRDRKVFVDADWVKPVAIVPESGTIEKAAQSNAPAAADEDAEDAAKEARYLKEITELLLNNTGCARGGVDFRAQQAALIIKHGKNLAARDSDGIAAFKFWEAAKIFCARALPPAVTQDLMDLYGDIFTVDLADEKHPEDRDLMSDWGADDFEVARIIVDAISGSQAAAKRLHVDGLQDLSPKDRCARIIQVLSKRYKARAERERQASQ